MPNSFSDTVLETYQFTFSSTYEMSNNYDIHTEFLFTCDTTGDENYWLVVEDKPVYKQEAMKE